MKKFIYVLAIISMGFAAASCTGSRTYNADIVQDAQPVITDTAMDTARLVETPDLADNEDPVSQDAAELIESSIPLDEAAVYFAKLQAIWDSDSGALWGMGLDAPVMFFDGSTLLMVANMPCNRGTLQRQGDVFVGVGQGIPGVSGSSVISWPSTGMYSGIRWGMFPWDWVESGLYDETFILRVLAHEAFHAIEFQFISGGAPQNEYSVLLSERMQLLDVQISVMLEVTALISASRMSGDARAAAIHDALSIRLDRRERYPDADIGENFYEIHEGMALYTDLMLVLPDMDERLDAIEFEMGDRERNDRLVKFGYWTGSLYGMLLDDTGADWKNGLTYSTDLAHLLRQHLGITEIAPLGDVDLERYGYSQIVQLI